ncbi:MAG: hypothetical protein AVDCRST_MAG93-2987, partial [uncultured Chloroflexia bacterium]
GGLRHHIGNHTTSRGGEPHERRSDCTRLCHSRHGTVKVLGTFDDEMWSTGNESV